MANPSIPPKAAPLFPDDEFGVWFARQIQLGQNRAWMTRNEGMLRKRWQTDKSDLPIPKKPDYGVLKDRYEELR